MKTNRADKERKETNNHEEEEKEEEKNTIPFFSVDYKEQGSSFTFIEKPRYELSADGTLLSLVLGGTKYGGKLYVLSIVSIEREELEKSELGYDKELKRRKIGLWKLALRKVEAYGWHVSNDSGLCFHDRTQRTIRSPMILTSRSVASDPSKMEKNDSGDGRYRQEHGDDVDSR